MMRSQPNSRSCPSRLALAVYQRRSGRRNGSDIRNEFARRVARRTHYLTCLTFRDFG